MKYIFTILLLVSLQAQARQYIQCADINNFDRAVVNLNGENSTLFMTNGVHLPDPDRVEVLKKLFFVEKNETHHIYETREGQVKETVKIENQDINVYSNYLEVQLIISNNERTSSRKLLCFSALYDQK